MRRTDPSQTGIALPAARALTATAALPANQPTRRQVGVALAFTASILLGAVLLEALSLQEARRWDFATRYAAGLIVRQGQGAKLYDVGEQTRVQQALFRRDVPLLELHPPFEAPVYAPLTKLPYLRAYVAWGLINIALWMLSVYLIRSCAPVPRQTFRYLILCFTFFPLWISLLQGQTSILLLLSYSLTLVSLRRRWDFAAGASLGLGLFKFQLVLPFALICAFRRKWRIAAGFGSAAAALVGLSTVAVGLRGLRSYLGLLLYTTRHPADPAYSPVPVWAMPTVRGFFAALMAGRVSPQWITAAVAAASLFLVLLAAWRWRQEDQREGSASQDLMFAAALMISLMTGFYMYAHDLSPMLLVVLLAIGSSQWSQTSAWRTLFMGATVVLYMPFVYVLLTRWHIVYLLWLALAACTLAIFGLLARSPGVVAPPAGG